MTPPPDYEFAEFRIDALRRRLVRSDGSVIPLTPKAFDTLLYLVQRPGTIVEKNDLLNAVWPGLVVEDNNLSQAVAAIRRALRDDAELPRFVMTVPRRGFRFVGAVQAVNSKPGAALDAAPPALPAVGSPHPEPVLTPHRVSAGHRSNRRRWIVAAVASAATATVIGVGFWAPWLQQPASNPAVPAQSLAVLPFKPLVIESRDELLEVGMADSLIARLSTLPGLTVRSISSVQRYAGPVQDPRVAARELNVDWVIDGAVQRWGDQIRVTARLLRADGTARWSGTFDEKFTGVFDVQDMISDRVAKVVAPQLGARDRKGLAASGTHNPDAFQLYTAARMQSQSIRSSGLKRSISFYKRAIEVDPDYALAWAGLAETHRRLPFSADTSPTESFEQSRAAALRALEIDPSLAEGYAALGWVKFWYEWDWKSSEQAFRRAIELNPNTWEAHNGLGLLLACLGRFEEGVPHIQRARELDPMSMIANTVEAGFLLGRGRRAEAEQRLARVLEIDPEFWVAYMTKADFYLADNDPAKAIESLRIAERYSGGESTQPLAMIGYLLARNGQRNAAQAEIDRLLVLSRERYVPPTTIAAVYSGLGENAKALDYLERAYEVRDMNLVFMKMDPFWDPLKDEPRFKALLHTMKLDRTPSGKAAH